MSFMEVKLVKVNQYIKPLVCWSRKQVSKSRPCSQCSDEIIIQWYLWWNDTLNGTSEKCPLIAGVWPVVTTGFGLSRCKRVTVSFIGRCPLIWGGLTSQVPQHLTYHLADIYIYIYQFNQSVPLTNVTVFADRMTFLGCGILAMIDFNTRRPWSTVV